MAAKYMYSKYASTPIKKGDENCRMCLASKVEFISLESIFHCPLTSIKYAEAYNYCLRLNAHTTDSLPKVICNQCAANLKFVYEVINKAIQSDKLLRQFLEPPDDPDEVDDIKQGDEVKAETNSQQDEEKHNSGEEIIANIDDIIYEDREYEQSGDDDEDNENENDEDEDEDGEETVDDDDPPDDEDFENTPVRSITNLSVSIAAINRERNASLVCEICGKYFKTKQTLKNHTLVHTDERKYACSLCPKSFKTSFRRKEHMRIHENIRRHECSLCLQRFGSKEALNCHMRRHTGERPYKCQICGKAFTQSSILKTHQALHTGKPFECKICYKRYSRSSHLNLHLRAHTGERPYVCHLCPNTYTQKSHLDQHLNTHLGVKHVCNICGKVYADKSTLNAHMYVHDTEKRFSCQVCGFALQTKYKYPLKEEEFRKQWRINNVAPRLDFNRLTRHLKTEHNVELPVERRNINRMPKPVPETINE